MGVFFDLKNDYAKWYRHIFELRNCYAKCIDLLFESRNGYAKWHIGYFCMGVLHTPPQDVLKRNV